MTKLISGGLNLIGRYRTEIDGLRAIAVCFVILFHFFPNEFPVGFLGVDLFFVISGYVITTQLQWKMRENKFSFLGFYTRRVRRILPLTFVVLLTTVIFGYFILLKADFSRLLDSAFATATFWANVFFWRDGGYFGGPDKIKPLLHMWSLAVEEQFYIVFPLTFWVLISLLKMRSIQLLAALTALTLLSFTGYLALEKIGGSSPAFFMMPTRAWQFGFGALAALIVADDWRRDSVTLSTISLVVLILCFFVTSPRFPSEIFITLAATTYLITTRGFFVADKLLSKSWMVYLGLRSFSLYLWHWPIVAFLGYAFIDGIPLSWKVSGIALTLILSELSYRAIEKPFRFKFSLRASFGLIAVCCALAFAMSSISSFRTVDSLPERLAAQTQTNYRCSLSDFVSYGSSRACIIKEAGPQGNVAILGNSHAQMYTEAISETYGSPLVGVTLIPLNGCLPTVNLNISKSCAEDALTNLNSVLADDSITTVFIGTTYLHDQLLQIDGTMIEDPKGLMLTDALIDLIGKLEDSNKSVFLIGPIQIPGSDIPGELSRSLKFGEITEADVMQSLKLPRIIFDARFGRVIDELSDRLGSNFLRPDIELCDESDCLFGDEDGSFFADSNHLGSYGIEKVLPIFSGIKSSGLD